MIFNITQLIMYETTWGLEYFGCPLAFAGEWSRVARKPKNNLLNSPRPCLME